MPSCASRFNCCCPSFRFIVSCANALGCKRKMHSNPGCYSIKKSAVLQSTVSDRGACTQ